MKRKGYRFLEHTADTGLKIYAPSREEVFETAAKGLLTLLTEETPQPGEKRSVSLTAESAEYLLADFLNEILYLMAHERWGPSRVSVDLQGSSLRACLEGSPLKEDFRNEVKAATWHRLSLKETDGRWEATIFFDL